MLDAIARGKSDLYRAFSQTTGKGRGAWCALNSKKGEETEPVKNAFTEKKTK
jgi:hypothetical protein